MNCNQSGAITCIGGAQKRIGGVGSAKYSAKFCVGGNSHSFLLFIRKNKEKISFFLKVFFNWKRYDILIELKR